MTSGAGGGDGYVEGVGGVRGVAGLEAVTCKMVIP